LSKRKDFIKEIQKDVKRKLEEEIESTTEFDPDKFFNLIMGLTTLRSRNLLPEKDIKELDEKLKRKMKELL